MDPEENAYVRVKARLGELALSQRDLAAQIGIPESAVSKAIRHHQGFDPHWSKIAQILNVSLDWLLLGRDPATPPTWDARVVNAALPALPRLWQALSDPAKRRLFLLRLNLPETKLQHVLEGRDSLPGDESTLQEWAAAADLDPDDHQAFIAHALLETAPEPVRNYFKELRNLAAHGPLPITDNLEPVAVREQGTVYVADDRPDDKSRRPFTRRPGTLPLVGCVAAGNQLISYVSEPREFAWKATWAVMRVEGTSAYPVIYPNQFAIVDTSRPVRHNNLVVVETEEPDGDGGTRMNAYLKRYCVDVRAPHGYVLASVNSGLDSPYIPPEQILVIVPVVGVLFEEPKS